MLYELALLVAIAAVLYLGLRKFPTILWSKKNRKRRDEIVAAYDKKIQSDRAFHTAIRDSANRSLGVETYVPSAGSLLGGFLKSQGASATAGWSRERCLVQTILPDTIGTYREMPRKYGYAHHAVYHNYRIHRPELKPITGEVWRAPKPIQTTKTMEVFLTFVDGNKGYLIRRKSDGAGLWCSEYVTRDGDIINAATYFWAMDQSPAIEALRSIPELSRITLILDQKYWDGKERSLGFGFRGNLKPRMFCREGEVQDSLNGTDCVPPKTLGGWALALFTEKPESNQVTLDLGADQIEIAQQIRAVCATYGLTPA